MYMDREMLEAKFEAANSMSCKPEKMYRYGRCTIIDVNKSVRWNREEVERRNNVYAEAVKALKIKRNCALAEVYEEVYAYIMMQVGNKCTREQAEMLWDYAWRLKRSTGFQAALDCLDELIELVNHFMDKGSKRLSYN